MIASSSDSTGNPVLSDTRGSLPWILVVCILVAGCQSTGPEQDTLSATVTDPSAVRLHEICEHLLLYYAQNWSLPPNLEALHGTGPGELPPLVSPVSGEAYLYYKTPVKLPERPQLLLIQDPTPAKVSVRGESSRWVVIIAEPKSEEILTNDPLVTQVIPLPISDIRKALTTSLQ